jgi:hypothetical protein
MTRQTLLQRQQTLARKKDLLAQKEKVLKDSLRKERVRLLIEKGSLLEKAGLLSLDTNTLYGALLEVAQKASCPHTLQSWTQKGGAAFSQEAKALNRSPILLQFPKQPPEEIRKTLRALGLRWNSLRQEWNGFAPLEPLQLIAQEHNATLTVPEIETQT